MYTVEERAKAREKVIKLLALAANNAATDAEKDTALQMARKLAFKYSFRIVEPGERMDMGNVSKANETTEQEYTEKKERWATYTVKSYDRKFVDWLLSGLGYKHIAYDRSFQVLGEFDINSFSIYYREIRKLYNIALSATKLSSCGWTRTNSKQFKTLFCCGLRGGAKGQHNDILARGFGYEAGFECGKKFQPLRKEGH